MVEDPIVFCPALDCFGVEWGADVQHAFSSVGPASPKIDLTILELPSPPKQQQHQHETCVEKLLESSDEDDGDGDDETAPTSGTGVETQTGRWTKKEHELFLEGLERYGKSWKHISNLVVTRTLVQIRTHAQKYLQKQNKASPPAYLTPRPAYLLTHATGPRLCPFPENDIDLLLEDDDEDDDTTDDARKRPADLQPIAPQYFVPSVAKRRRLDTPSELGSLMPPMLLRPFPAGQNLVHPMSALPVAPFGWLQGV
ncbi:hypothetical protein SPRG_02234 [Saprolegnia parasitica CBS 223.65]|uniref:Uncharacterized protein n=1 Tax=Saprolegnia parasitica (strain CBS 223.65) TaxID=695850 RepID=A0A067D317_SAPPC|nr:hypothetical protein SPRG_02234 [Saprolegnia parasitica CBS 223.65]KDO33427.1 hypothetical protein SPRG_02234 [Saprolegnia parasitica CBS 223.65]|eukprot:XP_012196173.1 hypothetical protein SPRG_02234 [Saprolegnia parasitica CBS 223.65]